MRISTSRPHDQGSVITAAAVSAAILSVLAAGFLTYMTNEGRLTTRSRGWKQALHLAEAAAEIGVAEYRYQFQQGGSGFTSGRGWTGLGGGSYSKSVSNFTSDAGSVIGHLSIGATGIGGSNPQITGIGTALGSVGPSNVARAVRVGLAGSRLFPMGILSKSTITMGGNATIDSYDSSDSGKSTGGLYDTSKKQANGNIATTSTSGNCITMNGNANVHGTAATGASGTMSMSGNAKVGPAFSGQTGSPATAETNGWLTHDYTTTPSDVILPAGLSSASSLGTINNDLSLGSGDWRASSISLAGNKTVTITGNVRLYITGNTSISGNAKIRINSGASLEVYAAGSVSIAGNGVNNNAQTPNKNMWYGLSTSTSWSLSGNADWIGTVYAPQAAVATSGNGEVSGAVVGNSIAISGNGGYHFDEALLSLTGSTSIYNVVSWQELRMVGGSWVP